MPASLVESFDPIEQALQASLEESHSSALCLDDYLAGNSKKILLTKVEYQPAERECNLSQQKLQAKYIHLNSQCNSNGKHRVCKPNLVSEMNGMGDHDSSKEDDGIASPNVMIHPPNKITLGWQRVYRIGAGLANLGNTCFLNAILQCLTYTPPLVNHLIEFDEHVTSCKNVGFCMMCELYRHIRRALEKNGETIKPQCILQKLKAIAKHMVWGRQEDAHEFLRYVMESMIKSSLNGHNPATLDRISLETTVVNHIFGGYHRSQVICLRCKEKSDTYDHFMDIILDIKNVPSLEKALEKFVHPEILDNENAYMCPKCKRKCSAQKRFTIHRAPNIATFQLKRFDYNRMIGGKITKHVTFPEKLDMRPYMSQRQGHPVMFQLYAVLVHQGVSCNSGHYFCFVRNSNNLWYIMDDCKVRQVSLNFVLSQQAYLLFYTRILNSSMGITKSSTLQPTCVKNTVTNMNGTASQDSSDSVGIGMPRKSSSPGLVVLKPHHSSSSLNSPASSSVSAPSATVSSANREKVMFGIKPVGLQQVSPSSNFISPTSSSSEGNQKHPRIVMHIKHGKVYSLQQKWMPSLSNSRSPSDHSSKVGTALGNPISSLVPYAPDSSEESDQENRARLSGVSLSPRRMNVNGVKHTVDSDANKITLNPQLNATVHLPGSPKCNSCEQSVISEKCDSKSSSKETPCEIVKPTEKSNPLSVITGAGNKVKATSQWLVRESCQQSPSLASEGSNTSVNSTTDWTVTDRDKNDGPKPELHFPGWKITPTESKKVIKESHSSFAKKKALFQRSQSAESNDLQSFGKVQSFDDSSKLLKSKHQKYHTVVKYHSDTETHEPQKTKNIYFNSCKNGDKFCNSKNNLQFKSEVDENRKNPSLKSDSEKAEIREFNNKTIPNKQFQNSELESDHNHPQTILGTTCKESNFQPSSKYVPHNSSKEERTQVIPSQSIANDNRPLEIFKTKSSNDLVNSSENLDIYSLKVSTPLINGHHSESSEDHHSHKRHKKRKKRRHRNESTEHGYGDDGSVSDDTVIRKLKKKKKKHRRHDECHRHHYTSDSSSSSYELEWVERTKETLEQEEKRQNKIPSTKHGNDTHHDSYKNSHSNDHKSIDNGRSSSWDSRNKGSALTELLKTSTWGYGNSVHSWDGTRNQLDTSLENDIQMERKHHYSDDYDEDLDRGRVKKSKPYRKGFSDCSSYNPFQKTLDMRNESKHQDQRFSRKPYYKGSHNRMFRNCHSDSKVKYLSMHKH